jgi:histidinol-phosphate aminotransferase
MERQEVYIGRIWPIMPTHVRITVGTHDEMQRFQDAYHRVMTASASIAVPHAAPRARLRQDGAVQVGV